MIQQLNQNELAIVYGGGSGDEKGDEPRAPEFPLGQLNTLGSGDEKGDEP